MLKNFSSREKSMMIGAGLMTVGVVLIVANRRKV